jgi:hypothetical protein
MTRTNKHWQFAMRSLRSSLKWAKIGEYTFNLFVWLVAAWIIFAFSTQVYFMYLHFSGQEEKATRISNEVTWKIDGRFKDNPDNIWYEKK